MMYRSTLTLLAVTTALASGADALAQATGGARTTVRTRCVNCAPTRDSSLRVRQERLLLRIDSLRWQYENIRLSDSERDQVAREMARTVMALESLFGVPMVAAEAAVAPTVAVERRAPRPPFAVAAPTAMIAAGETQLPGYIGATFDGPHIKIMRDDQLHIRFYQYPKIAMVDASSPAERAGILEGDTLLALDGTDVKTEISLTKLLVPDARFVVRVRREGDTKDLNVTVREAPDYYVRRATPLPSRPRSAIPPGRVDVYGVPPTPPVAETAPVAPMGRARMWIYNDGVAGARVETISEGLGKTVGVKAGVLVISAEPGTPAHRSGLRDGDVILRAAGRSVATVRGLRGIVAEGEGDSGVKLEILRERKKREVTLRW